MSVCPHPYARWEDCPLFNSSRVREAGVVLSRANLCVTGLDRRMQSHDSQEGFGQDERVSMASALALALALALKTARLRVDETRC